MGPQKPEATPFGAKPSNPELLGLEHRDEPARPDAQEQRAGRTRNQAQVRRGPACSNEPYRVVRGIDESGAVTELG